MKNRPYFGNEITNRKWHTPFHMRWESSTLDDLDDQYCNRNCTGCSAGLP